MNKRYCFEILEDRPFKYCFSYIDSEDNLADFLFDYLKVSVEPEMEFHHDDEPFKIILCHIPWQDRENFLHAIDLLPGLMAYAGKTGYDEYCRGLMVYAQQHFAKKGMGGRNTLLQ